MVSARDGQSYGILRKMKAKVDPRRAGHKVLSIRRTRKDEVLLIRKKGGEVLTLREELDRAVGERAEISTLVSTRSLKIRDLDKTVEKEEVGSVLCFALGRPVLDGSCRLFTRFGGVQTAVIRLAEADAARLLQLGKVSKSPEWGEARLDRGGILISEMVARNDLIVLNQGKEFTFRRGTKGSIIHLTIAAPRLASMIGDLCVLEVITLSDHR